MESPSSAAKHSIACYATLLNYFNFSAFKGCPHSAAGAVRDVTTLPLYVLQKFAAPTNTKVNYLVAWSPKSLPDLMF
jgi:hypothetical protein